MSHFLHIIATIGDVLHVVFVVLGLLALAAFLFIYFCVDFSK